MQLGGGGYIARAVALSPPPGHILSISKAVVHALAGQREMGGSPRSPPLARGYGGPVLA